MKKYLFMAAVLVASTLFMPSCEQEAVQVQSPTPPPVPEMAFTTVVRVPLGEPNAVTGEADILNPSLMEAENQAILAPTFKAIWKALQQGKLAAFPIDTDFPQGVSEADFLSHVAQGMEENNAPLNEASMTSCLEVEFAGKAQKGSSKMEATWLRFVWVDPGQVLPDRNICQVKVGDLKDFTVSTKTGTQSFAAYLNARNYDGYPINVGTEQGIARVKTYEEARKMEVMTARGELDQLTYYEAN